MAKRVLLVLILAAVAATGAFAQFSMGAGVIGLNSPVIDFECGISKTTSIMWGSSFGYTQQTTSYNNNSTTTSSSSFDLYVGPSFTVATAGQWSVYIPLLAWLYTWSDSDHWTLDIQPGIRAKYAFNKNWSLYTGIGINFIEYEKYSNTTYTRIGIRGGKVVLGFLYKFGN